MLGSYNQSVGQCILHVEDDPALAFFVRFVFDDLGFKGMMLKAESIRKAFDLLVERERCGQGLSLIISDLSLPDGNGLELIRELKIHPFWKLTPVIVLSGEKDPTMVNAAYALGANTFLPKDPAVSDLPLLLKSFFKCWLDNVQAPQSGIRNRAQEILDRAAGLRVRTCEFFLNLARRSTDVSETQFWVNRAMDEGNLSNLLAFFRDKVQQSDFPAGVIDRVVMAHAQTTHALIKAERHLKETQAPGSDLCYTWMLELTMAVDELVVDEALACLLPKAPAVTAAFRARAAAEYKALAEHVLDHTLEEGLREKAIALLNKSQLLLQAV